MTDLDHVLDPKRPKPALAFFAGEYLRDELAERGWGIAQFAEIIGRPFQAVSEILNGRKAITPATAAQIGAATGTDPYIWLSLQAQHDLWLLDRDNRHREVVAEIRRRAQRAQREAPRD